MMFLSPRFLSLSLKLQSDKTQNLGFLSFSFFFSVLSLSQSLVGLVAPFYYSNSFSSSSGPKEKNKINPIKVKKLNFIIQKQDNYLSYSMQKFFICNFRIIELHNNCKLYKQVILEM